MRFLSLFLVIVLQVSGMAQITVPDGPKPAAPGAGNLAPIPDGAFTPGGIESLVQCAVLAAEIEATQMALAEINSLLGSINDPNDPILFPLILTKFHMEFTLLMLRMQYAVLCGGDMPPIATGPAGP